MNQKRLCSIVAVLVLLMTGCAFQQAVKDDPVKGSYYVARASFNDALESYVWHREMLSADVQEEIEPLFFEGATALDLWRAALSVEGMDPAGKAAAYNKIKNELFRLMFRYNVLTIE